MEQMTEQEGGSLDIVNENLEALKAIFPEAFSEDGVNFETLRQLLGDDVDESISRDEVESLAQGIIDWHKELEPASDTQVVYHDSAFADDIAKTNMTGILEQNGIAHVRSL